MDTVYLRWLVDSFSQIQKTRIQMTNRLKAFQKSDQGIPYPFIEQVIQEAIISERLFKNEVSRVLEEFPIWREWLKHVKGVGPITAGKLIAYIRSIESFPTASKLRRYCGYAVINGKAERGVGPDGKLHYNKKLKATLYNLEASFLRSQSAYRKIYDKAKLWVSQKNSDWPRWRQDRKARRMMIQLFLSHLWEVWRKLENLPVRAPYPIEYLGHVEYISPWEMIEPKEELKSA